jgi:uncharacterized SAM-binding protein YcdF (DUF218 family)
MSYINFAFPFFIALAIWGLIRARRSCERKSWRLAAAGVCGVFLISYYPLAWLLIVPLESSYDENPIPHESAQALVVLSGGVEPPVPDRPYSLAQAQTYERCRQTAWLYKTWRNLPVLASGGGPFPEPLSVTMRHVLEAEGVPPDKIWIEIESHSTYENAVYSTNILREHGISQIVLVDQARFLPRAVACFRKQGIKVVPAPFNFTHIYLEADDILPSSRAIQMNGETIHEYVGLLWYRLRGRI